MAFSPPWIKNIFFKGFAHCEGGGTIKLGQPRALAKPSKIELQASSLDPKIERQASSLDQALSPRLSSSVEHWALDHEIERHDLDLGAVWYGHQGQSKHKLMFGLFWHPFVFGPFWVSQYSWPVECRASSFKKHWEKSSIKPRPKIEHRASSPKSSVEP